MEISAKRQEDPEIARSGGQNSIQRRRTRDGSRRFSAADWALPDRAPNVKALTFSQFKLKIIGNLILNGTLVISIDPKNATILRYLTIDRKRASCDEGG
jgi:hypothetical protein